MQQAENDLGQIATGSTMFSPMNLFSREYSVTAAPDEVRVSSVGTSAPSVSARVGTRKGYLVGNRSGHRWFQFPIQILQIRRSFTLVLTQRVSCLI